MAICLVGTRWGRFLGAQLRQIYAGPLFICGLNPVHTRRIARSLDAEDALIGWESAVRHPAISILLLAIPAQLHRTVGVSAALRGKHVLVEKPLATSIEDCDALIQAARSSGVVLAVGENIPFRADVREAGRLLPQIGEPRLFFGSALHNANGQNDLSVGILLDFSVHHIRAVRELYGEPDRVYASRARGSIANKAEDNVTLMLSSDDGWQATLALSWQASPGLCPEFIATGSRGAMKIWPDGSFLDLYPLEPQFWTRAIAQVRPYWLRKWLESPETQRRRFKLPKRDRLGYQAELRQFLEAIEQGYPDVSSALEARRDLEIALAAHASLASGGPVDCRAETRLQVA
jgi:predicted dehydrogenase